MAGGGNNKKDEERTVTQNLDFDIAVLDTSVFIKWFKEANEPYIHQAVLLKQAYLHGDLSIVAPDLVVYEIGNILALKSDLMENEAVQKLQDFLDTGIEIVTLSQEAIKKAMSFCFRESITFYDASFAALANQLECPFITADRKLHSKIKGSELFSVLFISNISGDVLN